MYIYQHQPPLQRVVSELPGRAYPRCSQLCGDELNTAVHSLLLNTAIYVYTCIFRNLAIESGLGLSLKPIDFCPEIKTKTVRNWTTVLSRTETLVSRSQDCLKAAVDESKAKADDRGGQLNLAHGTETKNKEKLKTKTE